MGMAIKGKGIRIARTKNKEPRANLPAIYGPTPGRRGAKT
jgi:hypothetical protein